MPAHKGIFEGPIPMGVATMLGVSFDRFNLVSQQVERFDPASGEYSTAVSPKKPD